MSSTSATPHEAQHMSAATKFSVLIFWRYYVAVLCHCQLSMYSDDLVSDVVSGRSVSGRD
eukprot:scaffold22680_cov72-Skeletonema_dohrnii-CCMP3373.AAC.1